MSNYVSSIPATVLILIRGVRALDATQFQPPPQVTVRLRATLSGQAKPIERIAFSPNGKLIATSSEDYTVRLWDAYTGELKAIRSGEDKAKWEQER